MYITYLYFILFYLYTNRNFMNFQVSPEVYSNDYFLNLDLDDLHSYLSSADFIKIINAGSNKRLHAYKMLKEKLKIYKTNIQKHGQCSTVDLLNSIKSFLFVDKPQANSDIDNQGESSNGNTVKNPKELKSRNKTLNTESINGKIIDSRTDKRTQFTKLIENQLSNRRKEYQHLRQLYASTQFQRFPGIRLIPNAFNEWELISYYPDKSMTIQDYEIIKIIVNSLQKYQMNLGVQLSKDKDADNSSVNTVEFLVAQQRKIKDNDAYLKLMDLEINYSTNLSKGYSETCHQSKKQCENAERTSKKIVITYPDEDKNKWETEKIKESVKPVPVKKAVELVKSTFQTVVKSVQPIKSTPNKWQIAIMKCSANSNVNNYRRDIRKILEGCKHVSKQKASISEFLSQSLNIDFSSDEQSDYDEEVNLMSTIEAENFNSTNSCEMIQQRRGKDGTLRYFFRSPKSMSFFPKYMLYDTQDLELNDSAFEIYLSIMHSNAAFRALNEKKAKKLKYLDKDWKERTREPLSESRICRHKQPDSFS